ncbi:hypothetical protein HDU86_007101 [Geranomyces michiganensis]|nr:hypothetical protein HDU86_007101 [Geranomyces michiganensis]
MPISGSSRNPILIEDESIDYCQQSTLPSVEGRLSAHRGTKPTKKKRLVEPSAIEHARWDGAGFYGPNNDLAKSDGHWSEIGALVEASGYVSPQCDEEHAKSHKNRRSTSTPAAMDGTDRYTDYSDFANGVGSSNGFSVGMNAGAEFPPSFTPPPLPPKKKLKTSDSETDNVPRLSAYAALDGYGSPASGASLEIMEMLPSSSDSEFLPSSSYRKRPAQKRTSSSTAKSQASKSEPKRKPDPDKPKKTKKPKAGPVAATAPTSSKTKNKSRSAIPWSEAYTQALVASCREFPENIPYNVYAVLGDRVNKMVGVNRQQIRDKCRLLQSKHPEIDRIVARLEAADKNKKPVVPKRSKKQTRTEVKAEKEVKAEVKEESALEAPNDYETDEQPHQEPLTDEAGGSANACNGNNE